MSGKPIPLGGLEGSTRVLLNRLHRAFSGPFKADEVSEVLGVSQAKARRLLAHLAAKGWLARVRRGLYTTVPLEASEPEGWLADPWAVAARTFAPCYVGGWSALHHWELTEQLFRSVVIFTATSVRNKERVVQGTTFRLRQVSDARLFGLKTVWRQKTPVQVSDRERTLVDCLDRPAIGGGIRHVADCVEEWLAVAARVDVERLVEHGDRLGNRAVFKRLGYLLEARSLAAPELSRNCAERISSGVSPLDPSSETAGRIIRRWRLRVNARV